MKANFIWVTYLTEPAVDASFQTFVRGERAAGTPVSILANAAVVGNLAILVVTRNALVHPPLETKYLTLEKMGQLRIIFPL
jgi:hypothetical protein